MGSYRAVKVVYRSRFTEDRPYEREFHGMTKFEPVSRTHDGFVDILQVGRTESSGYYYCVMELADDVVFNQRINPLTYQAKSLDRYLAERELLTFEESVQIGVSLAAALSHLHENGLIHRDIKRSNIIFVHGIPKIADIGLVAEAGVSHSLVGTEGFMPPEGPGTIEADIFSLGKVLYEISTGQDRKAFPELPTEVTSITTRKEFSELNEVILRACERDVQKRYRTAREMHRDLLLLQAGKSVKRLRLLEKRMAAIKRIGVVGASVMALCIGGLFQINREMTMAAERRQQAVGRNVAYGTRFVDEGDFFGALPPFVEALRLDYSDPEHQEKHRLRIGSTLRQCPRVANLWFLDSQIHSAALSSDGRYLSVAGADGTGTLCDVEGDSLPTVFANERIELEGTAFSRDGQMMLTTGKERVVVWDARTKKRISDFSPPGTVYNAQFSPDGTQIISASRTNGAGYLQLWEAKTGNLITVVGTNKEGYRFASFSPDGTRVVAAGEHNLAEIWHLPTRQIIATIQHRNWVYYARFSPDGRQVVTASFDFTALVSDAATGREVAPPFEHLAGVKSAEFSPDGRYVVTACFDYTSRIWKISRRDEPLAPNELIFPLLLKHKGKHVIYASFTPDGRKVITANANGTISLWDLAPTGFVRASSKSILSENGEVAIWLENDRIEARSPDGATVISRVAVGGPVDQVRLSHDGRRVLVISGPSKNTAQLFDTRTGQAISPPFSVLTDSVDPPDLSADGQVFVIASKSQVQIWNAMDGTLRRTLLHELPFARIWLNYDGSVLISATKEATRALAWNTRTGAILTTFTSEYPIGFAAFSPDEKYLATCSSDDTLFERYAQIWDFATGNKVGPPLEHADGVTHGTFSSDGNRFLTASEDNTARLWEVGTGKLLLTLPHRHSVTDACFSPNGRLIATACQDSSARVWDAETGEPITPRLYQEAFRHVQFAAGGFAIATRSSKNQSVLWQLHVDHRPVEKLVQFARVAGFVSGPKEHGATLPRIEASRESWRRLRADQASEFSVTHAEIVGWHRREAEASEKEKNWSAAQFHWMHLQLLEPTEDLFKQRGEMARVKIMDGKGAAE